MKRKMLEDESGEYGHEELNVSPNNEDVKGD